MTTNTASPANDQPANAIGPVDRDIPDLTTKKRTSTVTRLLLLLAAAFAVIALGTGITIFIKRMETNKREEQLAKARSKPAAKVSLAKNFDAAKKRILDEQERSEKVAAQNALDEATTATGEVKTAAAIAVVPAGARAAGSPGTTPPGMPAGAGPQAQSAGPGTPAGGGRQANGDPILTPAARRLSGDVLIEFPSSTTLPQNMGNQNAPAGGLMGGPPLSQGPKNGFDDKLKPSQLVAGVAGQRPDLTYLLRRGTVLPCGKKTLSKTTHPGMAVCVVSKDVYSANGKVLLIERGSEAFGEQREGLMRGQDSMQILWTRIDTPRGVVIDINSLGTDALGASGVPAFVDHHLLERFGGAVMLSLITDIGQALANKAGDGGGTLRLSTTANAGQDLASKTLESTINIPPTGISLQGSAINILVARDMDFRSVYELATY